MARARNLGFTLLELVAALGILALLATVAAPLYTAYSVRGHRAAAQADLLRCAQGMERHGSLAFSYAGAIDADNDGVGDSDVGAVTANICTPASSRYAIVLERGDAASFLLRASPAAADGLLDDDGDLAVDESGTRLWDRNDDGDFDDAGESGWAK